MENTKTQQLIKICGSDPKSLNISEAKRLIKEGADVNFRFSKDVVLDISLNEDCPNIEFLVYGDLTPLVVACYMGNLDLAEVLLDAGASDERAIYAVAAGLQHLRGLNRRLDLIKILLRRGFDFRVAVRSSCYGFSNDGSWTDMPWKRRTPLCVFAEECNLNAVGNLGVVKFFLEMGADPNDCSPLWTASVLPGIYDGTLRLSVTRLLLEAGADPDVYEDGSSLLGEVVRVDYRDWCPEEGEVHRDENCDLARQLLEFGADPNVCDDDGISPLEHAVEGEGSCGYCEQTRRFGYPEMADVLLDDQRPVLPEYEDDD